MSKSRKEESHTTLKTIVYAAIAAGIVVIGTGVTYTINFENRITKLETQIDFIYGVSSVPKASYDGDKQSLSSESDTNKLIAQADEIRLAIGNGCVKYMDMYRAIVGQGALYSFQQSRLDALEKQMKLLGCDTVLK